MNEQAVKRGRHRLKPPSAEEDEAINRGIAADEDTREIDEADLAKAIPARQFFAERGMTPPRPRGRPRKAMPKQQVTIRLDADLLERLRASGKGWQTRLNDAIRRWLDEQATRKS